MDINNHLPFSLNESVFLKVKYCLIHSQNITCHFVKLLINILPIRWLFWIRKFFACSTIVAESYNILEQKYIFQIGTLNLTVSTSPFHSTNLFLFSHHHIPTDSVAPLLHINPHTTHNSSNRSDEGLTLETSAFLRWSIYDFNSVVNTKLPAIFSHLRSTTISLETYPLYSFIIKAAILELMAQEKALFTAVNLVTITFSFSGKSQVRSQ